jgi:ABC-type transport system involved in cytochrome c biogenesis permease subunit
VFYNGLNPFYKTQFFYGFSFIFFLLSLIFFRKKLAVIAFTLIISGFLLHTAGIVLRMLIMHRPPVTNLYETFVFTSWMSVCLGLLLELFKKRGIGIISSSIAGVILLLIAGKYSLDGDNLGMLSAVLNSNFWLAVHVITISIGFAGIIMSGVAGHVYLLQTTFGKPSIHKLKETFQAIYATQAFGLIFTFLGTVLGGYWADQSWGRFWGWDPKENGALIIILWSAVLFHARKTNWMKDKDFALGSIGGIIAVVLTWFGINLLGVGLHSYGFTTGIAVALLIFLMFEFLFLITAFLKTRALNT